jgi:predicted transposase/invertase (TIGR01784 family)
MPHPHDYGYKDLFSHPQFLKELLTSCVPEPWVTELDFSHASLIDKSFITPAKKKLESDLIWRIPLTSGNEVYFYILIEFQSTVDHFMALRMLRYILELYGSLLKADPQLKVLPPVFPLLLYNGDARWTAPENLADLIDRRISLDYIPQFRYFKIAENEFSKERLLSLKNMIGALFLVETTKREELVPLLSEIVKILEQEQPEVYRAFIQWLFSFFSEPVPDWVGELSQLREVPTMLATTVKQWEQDLVQQGLQQGLQKGLQQGLQKGLLEGEKRKALATARKLKQKGMSIQEIAELTGLSIEEVQAL